MKSEPQNNFGKGEGELCKLYYSRPLPMRLDRWLVSQRSEQSRARIQKFIEAGLVLVNGIEGRAKTPLRSGDEIQLWIPPPEPLPYLQAEEMELNILFEDKEIIVINKAAGIAVHPAPGNKDGTLINGILHHCKNLPGIGGKLRPGVVHRLDKDTTGCIVVAKTQEALVNLQTQIQKRIATRIYIAIVHGVPKSTEGVILGNIGRHPINRKKYTVVSDGSGRHACTNWKLIERLGNYSVLSFKLDTGRTHQIRVHSAHQGNPILGDPTYSRCKRLPTPLSGQALHAIKLELNHPKTHKRLLFEANIPDEFQRALTTLRNRSAKSNHSRETWGSIY